MKLTSAFLFASLLMVGCFNNPFGFKIGEKVKGSTYASPLESIDYRAEQTYLAPLDNSEERGLGAFQEVRARVQELFDGELAPDFEIPVAVLEAINAVDLTVVDNETIFAKFPVPFRDDELDVEATIRVNEETKRLNDTFVVNGIKRVTVAHDLFGTVANATIFDKDEEPRFTADFNREGNNLNLLIANINNENSFLIDVDNESLFLGREKDHDGKISENFEFQARVNTDEVAGRLDAKIIFFGNLNICFGPNDQGDIAKAECQEIDADINGIGDGIGPF
jgi:hypothetical protein